MFKIEIPEILQILFSIRLGQVLIGILILGTHQTVPVTTIGKPLYVTVRDLCLGNWLFASFPALL